jgi:hypothetical protein
MRDICSSRLPKSHSDLEEGDISSSFREMVVDLGDLIKNMVVLASGHPDRRSHYSQFLARICTQCPHLRQHAPAYAPISRAHVRATPEVARAVRPCVGTTHVPPLLTRIVTCATPDLLLKHPDATLVTYV